jgi:hypothetical protein
VRVPLDYSLFSAPGNAAVATAVETFLRAAPAAARRERVAIGVA